MKTQQMF